MSDLGSPAVKPEVLFIDDLLTQVESGRLRVPRFQRPYQWRPKQMTFLFDSIRQGYPIGSLLMWETDQPVAALGKIGPLVAPEAPEGLATYVLDGHQRL